MDFFKFQRHHKTAKKDGTHFGEDRISEVTLKFVIVFALSILAAAVVWAVVSKLPGSFQLHFNPYALLSAVSLVSNLVLLALITRIKARNASLMWFSVFLMGMTFWNTSELFMRLSAVPLTATFWAPITTLGSLMLPVALFMFALSYTESKRAQHPLTAVSLFATSLFLIYVDFRTDLIGGYAPSQLTLTPWSYYYASGPGSLLFILWVFVMWVSALVLISRYRRRIIEPHLRRQARLFVLAFVPPIVIGTITDGVLPAFGFQFLSCLSLMFSVTSIVIGYGILKYRFFSFSPTTVATQILGTMNEAVIGINPDFRISYANAGTERLLGVPVGELSHRKLSDFLIQPWSPAQLRRNLIGMLDSNGIGTLDSVDFRTSTGSVISAKLSITKVSDEGQSYGYLVVLTDITAITQATTMIEHQVAEQTKTIRETKARLVSSINSLEFGFMMTDNRPEIITTNVTAHKVFCGSTKHDSADCPVVTLGHIQELLGTDVPIAKTIAACLKLRRAQGIKTLSFQHRIWRMFVSPVVDGATATGTTIIIQDITEEQILARSRDEFFSIASHELRTPLTAIRGNTSMMLQYYPEALADPSLHDMVNDIYGSSERLIKIVNDFLDASRLEQGRFTYRLEEVTFMDAAEEIVYELGATMKQQGLFFRLGESLRSAGLPHVIADRSRLKQILYNLAGNAAKFTETGGITLDAVPDGDHLKVTVTDTGRGMSPEAQALLFHKFQQATDSILTRDDTRGTGLGLYISRLLAQGMHGSLKLEHSEPGKGSVFALLLPLATPARLKRLDEKPAAAGPKAGSS